MSRTELMGRLVQASQLLQSARADASVAVGSVIHWDLDLALLYLSGAIMQVRYLPDSAGAIRSL